MLFKGISLKIGVSGGWYMNRTTFNKLLEAQERIATDPTHQALWEEHEALNLRFQQQLETMTPEQQAAVTDYFGLVIELHLRTLKTLL